MFKCDFADNFISLNHLSFIITKIEKSLKSILPFQTIHVTPLIPAEVHQGMKLDGAQKM